MVLRGPVGFRPDSIAFDLRLLKSGTESMTEFRPGVSLSLGSGDLFDNTLVEVFDTVMTPPESGYYIYGPYVIGPEVASFADWGDLQSRIEDGAVGRRAGLYVHADDKGWLWAGGEYDSGTGILHSELGGAGIIAIIADTAGPVIADLNITENHRVKVSRPPIRFTLTDELSGIENDLNFNVTIDVIRRILKIPGSGYISFRNMSL